jgi:hypothetical protein
VDLYYEQLPLLFLLQTELRLNLALALLLALLHGRAGTLLASPAPNGWRGPPPP